MNPHVQEDIAIIQSGGKSSEVIHERAFDLLRAELVESASFLDLGCGGGAFARRVKKAGLKNVSCCDGGRFGDLSDLDFREMNLNQPLGYAADQFDLVASIEVIEHIENPRAFVREIFRILKPGGTVLLSTPNNESFTSLISLAFRGYFSAFSDRDYPAHITPLLCIDALRILGEAGFRDCELSFSDSGRVPSSNLHWQSLLFGLAKGRRFSDNFFVKARKP
jgi:2-polyprenyl-3-methyl-5-hydroxy-6-metoxy-1,4-benzoquinol methylase